MSTQTIGPAETPVQNKDLVKRKKVNLKHFLKADQELKTKLRAVLEDENMSYDDVLKYINNEIKESTRVVNFNYVVKCFKEDGAYALSRAVEKIHGFTTQADEKNISGTNPPAMIDVRFASGERKKVPFGQINLPSLGKDAYIEMGYDVKGRTLTLIGQCEKRFVRLMDEMVEETKDIVENDSIYKGMAIKIKNEESSPEFIDLAGIEKVDLFLTDHAKYSTQPIEARIEHTNRCQRDGIDLRFGVLLEGNYGTGKTLYAFKLAQKAIRNGWSFVYCPTPEKALYVLEIANMLSKNGKGVVVFLEDIDKILNERTNLTNQISVIMDGGETKSNNVITIFTTNHVENIDPTFLRGKRIGSIVTLTHPDKATAKKMIESMLVDHEGNTLLEEDCEEAAAMMEEGKIVPAFIAEILERVKSHLIYSDRKTISTLDIVNSIKSYQRQMEIATVKMTGKPPAEQLVDLFKSVLGPAEPAVTKAELETTFGKAGFKIK